MVGNLDYAKAQGFPDLLGRKTYALGMAHGVDHFTGQVEEFVGKVGDRLSFLVKDAFSVLRDAQGHVGESRLVLEFDLRKCKTRIALIEDLSDVNKNRLQNRADKGKYKSDWLFSIHLTRASWGALRTSVFSRIRGSRFWIPGFLRNGVRRYP